MGEGGRGRRWAREGGRGREGEGGGGWDERRGGASGESLRKMRLENSAREGEEGSERKEWGRWGGCGGGTRAKGPGVARIGVAAHSSGGRRPSGEGQWKARRSVGVRAVRERAGGGRLLEKVVAAAGKGHSKRSGDSPVL